MGNGKSYSIRIEDMLIVDGVEKLLSRVINSRNIQYNEAVRYVFLFGYEKLIAMSEFEITDAYDKLNIGILRELQKIQFEENRDQHLYKLLEKMGRECFTEWCIANSVNPEPIIGGFAEFMARETIDETKNIGLWLEDKLHDYMPHRYTGLLVDAQIDGILPDQILYPDEYRSKLKTLSNIASSRGYSSRERRGVWQKMPH